MPSLHCRYVGPCTQTATCIFLGSGLKLSMKPSMKAQVLICMPDLGHFVTFRYLYMFAGGQHQTMLCPTYSQRVYCINSSCWSTPTHYKQIPIPRAEVPSKPLQHTVKMLSESSAHSQPTHCFFCIIPQSLGNDWEERVLPSIGNEVVKATVAQYNAEQLLTQRDKVSRAVSTLRQSC